MGMESKLGCDECGRQMIRAHRHYRGHRYCATCYAREFKPRACSRCGCVARLLRSEETAVCRKCDSDQPCVRCGKTDYAIGKLTDYGPVCNACSPYFRKPENCESCGTLSHRLARSSRLGHDLRVCPKCIIVDHATCRACHRHRLLRPDVNGHLLCEKCHQFGEIPCAQCQQPMPAGYGSRCERCYWSELLGKRLRMGCTAFSTKIMADHFTVFGQWLLAHAGEAKAAQTIHRYLKFFCDIEKQWADIPDYRALLDQFGTAKLRRVLLPMRWMAESGLVVIDEIAKTEDSERRRVAVIQERFVPGSIQRVLLDGYLEMMYRRLKYEKTTLKSIRLAVTPAAALLGTTAENCQNGLPNQKSLDIYLSKKPGQRAAISGFVGYLREVHSIEIELPNARSVEAKRRRRKALELELLTLMVHGNNSEPCRMRWVFVALAYFHGVTCAAVRKMIDAGLVQSGSGFVIICESIEYWLPAPQWWEHEMA